MQLLTLRSNGRLKATLHSRRSLYLALIFPLTSSSAMASMATSTRVIDSHLHVWANTEDSSTSFPYAQAPPDSLKDRASTVRTRSM